MFPLRSQCLRIGQMTLQRVKEFECKMEALRRLWHAPPVLLSMFEKLEQVGQSLGKAWIGEGEG